MVAIHRFTISIWLYHLITQTDQNRKERSTKVKELEQLKHSSTKMQDMNDFVAFTEKNEKQYVRLQLSILGTQEAFSPVVVVLLIAQQCNLMFKCRNKNTFHCRWLQINGTNSIYTNDSKKFLMWNFYTLTYPVCVRSRWFLKIWSISFHHLSLPFLLFPEWPYGPPKSKGLAFYKRNKYCFT